MKTLFIFLPIRDYIKTRRKLWRQYLIPLAAGIIVVIGAFAIDVRDGIDIEAIFSDFVGIQISGIATLVSFLLAIITILVSSDNENIRKLKSQMRYIIKSLVTNNLVCFKSYCPIFHIMLW